LISKHGEKQWGPLVKHQNTAQNEIEKNHFFNIT
jgi:hypothetical protein